MDEQVARDAGAVVAVIAPAEQTYGLERALRRFAQEALPIDIGRRGVGRNGVLPSAYSGVAIEPCFHHIELAYGAGLQQLPGLLINQRSDILTAHLKDAAAALLCRDDGLAFVDRLHHGLFAVHVFARVERFYADA